MAPFGPEKTADILAGSSVMLFAGLTLSEWHEIAQIFAGFGAFIAGVCSGYYYVFRAPRRDKKNGEQD